MYSVSSQSGSEPHPDARPEVSTVNAAAGVTVTWSGCTASDCVVVKIAATRRR